MLARFLLLVACLAAFAVPPSASARDVAPPATHQPHYFLSRAATRAPLTAPSSRDLVFQGGHAGTGVQPRPRVYVSFYGKQWGSAHTSSGNLVFSNDPKGLAPVLQRFLRGLYGTDTWSTSTTQYCDGVAAGTTQCGTAGRHVGHASTTALAGVWYDTTYNAPSAPTVSSFRAAAVRAAKHFGNTSGSLNASTQYVVVTPTGVVPPGFKTQYCAYHDWYASTVGDVAFVALPYIPDAGTGCGAYSVNHTTGALDGVTIVAGHEYAEALTDPFPPYGWVDAAGEENGDKCAWISSGAGAAANVTLPTGSFAVQSLWSNNDNRNAGGCVVYYSSATNQH